MACTTKRHGCYFHSISFPSEWGRLVACPHRQGSTISIQLVSPASGDFVGHILLKKLDYNFHSISFPSEWGLGKLHNHHCHPRLISIQLVSPASGDYSTVTFLSIGGWISIQLVSPASGDLFLGLWWGLPLLDFHSISFPSEWGPQLKVRDDILMTDFHSISFPSEWGRLSPQGLQPPTLGFPFN